MGWWFTLFPPPHPFLILVIKMKCAVKGCKSGKDVYAIYKGKPVCWRCWSWHCDGKRDLDKCFKKLKDD